MNSFRLSLVILTALFALCMDVNLYYYIQKSSNEGFSADWSSKVVVPAIALKSSPSPTNWTPAVFRDLTTQEYNIQYFKDKGCYQSPNRANNTRITYLPNQIQVIPRTLKELSPVDVKAPGAKRKVVASYDDYVLNIAVEGHGTTQKNLYPFEGKTVVSENNTASVCTPLMRVEYLNDARGTRQNFIIHQAVEGNELAVHLSVHTTLKANRDDSSSIELIGEKTRLQYRDLKVWDSRGKTLPARMILSPKLASTEPDKNNYMLLLAVNTQGAAYPITIDPIVANGTPSNANSTLELDQANANLGFSVSSAGDVNGDGYSDVIVGAPFYDNGQSDEGAAFVFHGSSSGVSTSVATTLECDQSGSLMGNSVAKAGDVNGDGYGDIIIGADFYDNGSSDEGAAFIYHGSSSGVSSSPNVILESNQNWAYFGNSVSSAGDVNGDGYSDVVVAAIEYDNGQSSEGAAFVYHGSSSGVSATPAAVVESNQSGGYLGSSVSSAGDVNGDGYSDVIAGAYLYDNGQTDEGAIFVFHGSSSGISTTPAAMLESNQASANFGISVSCAGDVDGDGYSDVIAGAHLYDNGQTDEGAAFVFYGSSSGISTTPAAMLESNQTSAGFGNCVVSAGDVNGDGYGDVFISAFNYDNGQSDEGAAFVYHGSSSGVSTTAVAIIESDQTDAWLGNSISSAGDVNGDGYSDVIVGAYHYDNGQSNEGAAFVYHGSANGTNTTAAAMAESNQASSYFGASVSCAGDVNGDGYSDVIVGAWGYDNGQSDEGAAFVYHGSSSGVSTTPAAMLEPNQTYTWFGYSVSSAGDVNGDGYSDVIVGAMVYDNSQSDEGAAFVYHGSSSGVSTTPATMLEPNQDDAQFGRSVSSAGDVNGDGYSDVIVGACYYDYEGAAFVYHGSSSGVSTTPAAIVEPNLGGISALFGRSVSSAGDVNGDGYSDVIVGASDYDNGQRREGATFVYHGSSSGVSTTPATIMESNNEDAQFGNSVSSAGDVNGDGYSDVAVGAPFYSSGGQLYEGAAFVYHGSSSGINTIAAFMVESDRDYALLGGSVSSAGDVNGDGYSDVIIGSDGYNNGQLYEGVAFVYHGSSNGVGTTPAAMVESNQANAQLGRSVSDAGDVNGDGYSDVIVGAFYYSNGQTFEGAAFVYHGNAGTTSRRNNLRLYNIDLSTPIQQSNYTDVNFFGAGLFATSPQGMQKVKMVWEVKEEGQPFSSAGGSITHSVDSSSSQSSFTSTGLSGEQLTDVAYKQGFQTKIRCRVQYDMVTSITGQRFGPWRYPQGYLGGTHGMNGTPLPVEWISFNAQWLIQGYSAQLNWATASEMNNSHYTLLRSTDGIAWEEIAQIKAAGTTHQVTEYSYIDPWIEPLCKAKHQYVYYRLMQTNLNGQFTFSDTKVLSLPEATDLKIAVFPNPLTQTATVEVPIQTKNWSWAPYNLFGQKVQNIENITENQLIINKENLAAGVYLYQVKTAEGLVASGKVTIE